MKITTRIAGILSALVCMFMLNLYSNQAMASVQDTTLSKNWSKEEESIRKTLTEKGYTHISQLSLTKSVVHKSEYFVTFTDDKKIYNAHFSKDGKLKDIKNVAVE